jgi:hypothetical protein
MAQGPINPTNMPFTCTAQHSIPINQASNNPRQFFHSLAKKNDEIKGSATAHTPSIQICTASKQNRFWTTPFPFPKAQLRRAAVCGCGRLMRRCRASRDPPGSAPLDVNRRLAYQSQFNSHAWAPGAESELII